MSHSFTGRTSKQCSSSAAAASAAAAMEPMLKDQNFENKRRGKVKKARSVWRGGEEEEEEEEAAAKRRRSRIIQINLPAEKNFGEYFCSVLVACTRLYMSLCLSVGP